MKKFGKSLFVLLFVPVLVLSCAMPAFADIAFDPFVRDPFYYTYRDGSYEAYRYYETAGESGSVELWSEPNGKVMRNTSNGELCYISKCQTEGDVKWGFLLDEELWVHMDDMELVYDHIEFMQDHSAEIEYLERSAWLQAYHVKCFLYPNGPEELAYVEEWNNHPVSFDLIYTDEAGLRWGYEAKRWVCIDDPMIEGAAEYVLASDVKKEVSLLSAYFPLILAAVLVLAVVIVTVVLIRKIPKRKEAHEPENEDTQSDV